MGHYGRKRNLCGVARPNLWLAGALFGKRLSTVQYHVL